MVANLLCCNLCWIVIITPLSKCLVLYAYYDYFFHDLHNGSSNYIWRLPNSTHSSLLPGLCETLPPRNVFFKRMIKLFYHCLNSQSSIVIIIVRHSILFGRMNSAIGRYVMSCRERYHASIDCIINHTFSSNNIDRVACAILEDACCNVNMLDELIQCRDGIFNLSNVWQGRHRTINFLICTNWLMLHFLCWYCQRYMHLCYVPWDTLHQNCFHYNRGREKKKINKEYSLNAVATFSIGFYIVVSCDVDRWIRYFDVKLMLTLLSSIR
jgi:hypothetical protein